jgi:CO/xanthine dehydrogenase Mo-binding subunit
MQQKVMKVILLEYLKTFDLDHQVHDMLALMLDHSFKSLHVVNNYVGHGNAIHVNVEFDLFSKPFPFW